MKKQNQKSRRSRATPRPTKKAHTILRQLVQWIPPRLADSLAKDAKGDIRSFSASSHILALLDGQITKVTDLSEICDAAQLHEHELNRIRGATAPKRKTFSNANRTRDPAIAENLYWAVFRHLQKACPRFSQYSRHKRFLFRLKRDIFAIDSTTLKQSLSCID